MMSTSAHAESIQGGLIGACLGRRWASNSRDGVRHGTTSRCGIKDYAGFSPKDRLTTDICKARRRVQVADTVERPKQ